MADEPHIQYENPSISPTQLNSIIETATDNIENSPKSNAFSENKISNGEMADEPQNQYENPPVSPPPQLTPTIETASDSVKNSPKSNGFSGNILSNGKIEKLRSSGSQHVRRSPRLLEIDGVKSSNKEAKSRKSDGLVVKSPPLKKPKTGKKTSFFIGDPVPEVEARNRWPWRYDENKGVKGDVKSSQRKTDDGDGDDDDEELVLDVKCHYSQAETSKKVFDLGDCAYVKGPNGGSNYVGKILEFFETTDGEDYVRFQWFFRAEDTVIKDDGKSHDKKRLFLSTLVNDNLLDCIVSKVIVVQIAPNVNSKAIPPCDFYYDMKYSVDYSTFSNIITDGISLSSTNYSMHEKSSSEIYKTELALLDMYSGCGGLSTGLCTGAKACGIDLVTRWAVDIDEAACKSLKLNHPETQIWHESGENFLQLLKEWDRMCKTYMLYQERELKSTVTKEANIDKRSKADPKNSCEYEVEELVGICYGDPNGTGKHGLMFKVRWVGYDPSSDTWEAVKGLSNCKERIRDFVLKGMKEKILPRPGDVTVLCGGPPCQGISGINRFRNNESPLDDERNLQIVVFMDIADFLRPKYVLMENVVDILRFAKGCLGRYAISRLVRMHYQARIGIMAAGCYGLPQFRLRAFLWGAHSQEVLPQFPLPTHDVVMKYGCPTEFERNVVAYEEGQSRDLDKLIVLSDAISDLPPVSNDQTSDKMAYKKAPETEFQKYIRADKCDMMALPSSGAKKSKNPVLYDHLPYPLNVDDYMRVCKIPKLKGANFRNLPGIVIGSNNVVRRTKEQCLMPSGKPWVPEYALNIQNGTSSRPFGRLWWDETVPTIFCLPDPHMRPVLHPEQDRLLSLRECARLQGFPDHYRFCGKLKERYKQVGNAVAVSVGRALGYSLGLAMQKLSGDEHVMILPRKFSHLTTVELQSMLEKSEK